MWHFSQDFIFQWLTHYGSLALFILLALGIFGLPVPDETLLVLSGYLMAQNKLSLALTILAAYCGSMLGISLSYLLGLTVGKTTLYKLGKYIGITEEKIAKTHEWYEKYGKWTLLIGYYIPGVRHLNGICAGTTYLRFYEFALFAYTGAIIWSSFFMSLGYFFYTTVKHWNWF